MPCIAIGPEEEEDEDQPPPKFMWATSCALSSGIEAAPENVVGGAAEEESADDDTAEAEEPLASRWCNKRVLFLEIDGILNTRPDPRIIHVERLPCLQLRRLLDASEAEVVLTSKWRKHHEYITEVLKNFGALPENRRELHRAPWNANPERRDLEILQWVNAHRDISDWVVLDARDLLRFPSAQRLEGHAIQVSPIEGLTGDVVAQALKALHCDKAPSRGVTVNTHQKPPPSEQVSPPADLLDSRAATGSHATSSLNALETDLASSLRSAFSWDADLAGKMEALLGSLPRAGDGKEPEASTYQDTLFPRSDSSRAEFQAMIAAAKEKFK